MTMPEPRDLDHDGIADRLLEWSLGEPTVRALWIEGGTLPDVRRPYRQLEAHLGADEPDVSTVVDKLPGALKEILGAELVGTADVPRLAKELRFSKGDLAWSVIVERTSMLAKRPRARVVALLDRTGHLTHVMDFSLRDAAGPSARR